MTTIRHQTVGDYLAAVAARQSTPGGGAVAAVAAAEGCALMVMVVNFTREQAALGDMLARCEASISRLAALADDDGAAFTSVMQAYRAGQGLTDALTTAARVPASIINICASHIEDLEILEQHGNPNLITDVGIAASLFEAALTASEMNILVNTRELEQPGELTAPLKNLDALRQRLQSVQSRILQSFK